MILLSDFELDVPFWFFWIIGLICSSTILYLIIYYAVRNAIQSSIGVNMAILNERIQQLISKNSANTISSGSETKSTGQSLNDRYKNNY